MGERTDALMDTLRKMRRVAACFPVDTTAITQQEVLHYE
jgi:hypothetical protein